MLNVNLESNTMLDWPKGYILECYFLKAQKLTPIKSNHNDYKIAITRN